MSSSNKTKKSAAISEIFTTNLNIVHVPISELIAYPNNARIHSERQIAQIASSIKRFGFNNPILIDGSKQVIAGHGRLLAAKQLGIVEVPVIYLDHMTDADKRAYILADNKLADKAGWDKQILKLELQELILLDPDLDLTITGFDTPEIDLIINEPLVGKQADSVDRLPDQLDVEKRVQFGDLWKLGEHYLYCGDSLKEDSFSLLLKGKKADLIFTDPPYNVPVQGHVGGKGKVKHDEFAFASGEMSVLEFTRFLSTSFALMAKHSRDGSIHDICMDWRHVTEIMKAGTSAYSELKNICVWNKQLGGMGSLYRSQHELIFVFKNGKAPHINNIELGKHGRNRSNIWDYPGVHVSNSHKNDLKLHPTVKPVMMIADAIVDCSKQGDIVLDCFGGSGSTLLAAERTKRRAYLIEFEPKYCDVVLHRYEKMTGHKVERVSGEI